MKKIKILTAGLMICSFFLTAHLNAQGTSGKIVMEDFTFWCSCANDGLGEFINGTIIWQETENNNFQKVNIKGKDIVGLTTGNTYNFTRTSHYDPMTGRLVMNTRNVQKGTGLVTFWQIIGEAEIGDSGDWEPLNPGDMKFYCTTW
jgi:hypothetical protein